MQKQGHSDHSHQIITQHLTFMFLCCIELPKLFLTCKWRLPLLLFFFKPSYTEVKGQGLELSHTRTLEQVFGGDWTLPSLLCYLLLSPAQRRSSSSRLRVILMALSLSLVLQPCRMRAGELRFLSEASQGFKLATVQPANRAACLASSPLLLIHCC